MENTNKKKRKTDWTYPKDTREQIVAGRPRKQGKEDGARIGMAFVGHTVTRDRAYGCSSRASAATPAYAKRLTRRFFFHTLRTKIPLSLLVITTLIVGGGAAIDCFKCVSVNGSNPACEDPFHNNYTSDILESPCMGGRKNRNGLFPATACIKLAGVYDDTGQRLTVRGCALDSGTLTTDTEIIRMSHCGGFYFDNRYVRGCLQSCDDADACNHASMPNHQIQNVVASVLVALLSSTFLFHHCGFR
ncbi:uncharacterized protein [Hetaerina americana]|uniref:uncharacterized protein n=1 Tax=Hetaerina americana TaxID=62018 RepID=UPI003A7F3C4C